MPTFPEFLKVKMGELGLNNTGLAVLAGVSKSVVGAWKKGTKPKAQTLRKLALVLAVDEDDLYKLIYGSVVPADDTEGSEMLGEILSMSKRLEEDDQRQAVTFLRFLLAERVRRERHESKPSDARKTIDASNQR